MHNGLLKRGNLNPVIHLFYILNLTYLLIKLDENETQETLRVIAKTINQARKFKNFNYFLKTLMYI